MSCEMELAGNICTPQDNQRQEQHTRMVNSQWAQEYRDLTQRQSHATFCKRMKKLTHLKKTLQLDLTFTRLTGLMYQPMAHEKLKYLYKKILRLSDKLPKNYPYKLYMEKIICHRMDVVEEFGDKRYKVESICNSKMEIMLQQAEAEFYLVRQLLASKPWEPLIRPPPGQWEWPPVIK